MFKRFGNWMQRAMAGRYGSDTLNLVILSGGLVLSLLGTILKLPILTLVAWIPLFWCLFRMFSRNTRKRYEENRRFTSFFSRLADKDYRYFRCPRCRQTVRVPKGKGKIAIKCPKCGEKFIKKT